MDMIDQKKYLKKYLSGGGSKKKQKRKKIQTSKPNVKIIDDDADFTANVKEDLEDPLNEDAPQVVGVIDERPMHMRIADYQQNDLWKPLGGVAQPDEQTQSARMLGDAFKINIKIEKDDDEPTPLPKMTKGQKSSNSLSENNPNSPEHTPSSTPNNNPKPNHDLSPPRRGKRCADLSPPRQHKEDLSPPRRRQRDLSPPRKAQRDLTPPRKAQRDLSPPRKTQRDLSPPRRAQNDLSPPRKRQSDLSPPRKTITRDSSPSRKTITRDSSPPRRKQRDLTPPRRNQNKSNAALQKDKSDENHSPSTSKPRKLLPGDKKGKYLIPAKRNAESKKATKTLDGKTAGLLNSQQLVTEIDKFRQSEEEMFKTLPPEMLGANATPVMRDRRTGKIRDMAKESAEQKEKKKKQEEKAEQYMRWGKGLKQVDDHAERLAQDLHEMNKPLARYADDEDLERFLKGQLVEGDPMLAYMRRKQKKEIVESGKPLKPEYQGEFLPNRYGIRPGYRWDGVDRSNGYEVKWIQNQNSRSAEQEDIYKWSTEDM